MTHLYVWQVFEDDDWGTIAAAIGDIPFIPVPLFTRDRNIARGIFRDIALGHAERSALNIRLARYEYAETLETLLPRGG